MKFREATASTLVADLRRFAKLLEKEVKEDNIDVEALAGEFNSWMNRLYGEDFFGTEGQNDPRGDHRD